MKQITINIPENKYEFIIQLIRSLKFVKIIENNHEIYNKEFVEKIDGSLNDYKEGKFKRVNINELDTFLGIK